MISSTFDFAAASCALPTSDGMVISNRARESFSWNAISSAV